MSRQVQPTASYPDPPGALGLPGALAKQALASSWRPVCPSTSYLNPPEALGPSGALEQEGAWLVGLVWDVDELASVQVLTGLGLTGQKQKQSGLEPEQRLVKLGLTLELI